MPSVTGQTTKILPWINPSYEDYYLDGGTWQNIMPRFPGGQQQSLTGTGASGKTANTARDNRWGQSQWAAAALGICWKNRTSQSLASCTNTDDCMLLIETAKPSRNVQPVRTHLGLFLFIATLEYLNSQKSLLVNLYQVHLLPDNNN